MNEHSWGRISIEVKNFYNIKIPEGCFVALRVTIIAQSNWFGVIVIIILQIAVCVVEKHDLLSVLNGFLNNLLETYATLSLTLKKETTLEEVFKKFENGMRMKIIYT